MEIQMDILRTAIYNILEHIEKTHGQEIQINFDYYWQLTKKNRTNPHKEPAEFELGQLSDDWELIKKIAANEKKPISYSLVWLSAILHTIGEELIS